MKKTILLLVLVSSFLFSFGQKDEFINSNSKGSHFLGAAASLTYDIHIGIIGNTGLRSGYFLRERLALGLEAQFHTNFPIEDNSEFTLERTYREVSLAPFLRYHLNDKKVSPFIEVQYTFGISNLNDGIQGLPAQKQKLNHLTFGAGVQFQKSKNISTELFAKYHYSLFKAEPVTGRSRPNRPDRVSHFDLGFRFILRK